MRSAPELCSPAFHSHDAHAEFPIRHLTQSQSPGPASRPAAPASDSSSSPALPAAARAYVASLAGRSGRAVPERIG